MVEKDDERTQLESWLGDRKTRLKKASTQEPLFEVMDALYATGPPRKDQIRVKINLKRKLDGMLHYVYYDVLEQTPIGSVLVAVTREGVVSISFSREEADLERTIKPDRWIRISKSSEHAGNALRQIREYLDGVRTRFDLPVDLSRLTDFQCRVLLATCQIPRGQVVSYAEIARKIGNPSASRAVGQALARNPVPIVIPCHRVVAADGSLTGYSGGGGITTKAKLLKLEGALLE